MPIYSMHFAKYFLSACNFALILVQRGWGRGVGGWLPKTTAARIRLEFGQRPFLLLILSVSENPLIACKLSLGGDVTKGHGLW